MSRTMIQRRDTFSSGASSASSSNKAERREELDHGRGDPAPANGAAERQLAQGNQARLQDLCGHYEAGRRLKDATDIRALIHSHMGGPDVAVRRWSLKALALSSRGQDWMQNVFARREIAGQVAGSPQH